MGVGTCSFLAAKADDSQNLADVHCSLDLIPCETKEVALLLHSSSGKASTKK